MKKKPQSAEPSEAAKSRLNDRRYCLCGAAIATRVWNQMLTAEDRTQLGEISTRHLHRHRGGIGIWMRLRHVSLSRALVDVAYGISLIDDPTRDWLLREIGENSSQRRQLRPGWNKATGELCYGEEIVRRVRCMRVLANTGRTDPRCLSKGELASLDLHSWRLGSAKPSTKRSAPSTEDSRTIRFHARDGG